MLCLIEAIKQNVGSTPQTEDLQQQKKQVRQTACKPRAGCTPRASVCSVPSQLLCQGHAAFKPYPHQYAGSSGMATRLNAAGLSWCKQVRSPPGCEVNLYNGSLSPGQLWVWQFVLKRMCGLLQPVAAISTAAGPAQPQCRPNLCCFTLLAEPSGTTTTSSSSSSGNGTPSGSSITDTDISFLGKLLAFSFAGELPCWNDMQCCNT